MKKLLLLIILSYIAITAQAQRGFILLISPKTAASIIGPPPEHGYAWLKGKKLKIYPTLGQYDFKGRQLRVVVSDDRYTLQLPHLNCSETEITNTSEYAGESGADVVCNYLQTLFPQANLIIDSNAIDTLKMSIKALDARLFMHFSGTVHGLCQIHVQLGNFNKTYCRDITDKDDHSPVSSNALVTRNGATRIMLSAAVREVIEQFFIDLQAMPQHN
jgi:hypothetical protein